MSALVDSLPFDIWHQIASCLEPHDYVSLSYSHPQLYSLLQDNRTARNAAKSHATSTAEVQLALSGASTYYEALERLYRVREAVATSQPFSATLLAYGDGFLFNQGYLCYLDKGRVRLLNVHQCHEQECVVNVKDVFLAAMGLLSQSEDVDVQITLLNYSDGIVACLCEGAQRDESYLLAIDVSAPHKKSTKRIRHIRQLRHTKKIFVRHNRSFLCYGTHSGTGRDRHREWLVRSVDLEENEDVTARPVQLRNFAGSDIGSTVCFEANNDGYFYAISNQTGFEGEEIDWTSYYICLRFPLSDPDQIQWQRIWRRQHREGPISDTWTDLSLRTDQSTGQLMIVESRREWLNDSSENYRTCYTQPLNWGETSDADADAHNNHVHDENGGNDATQFSACTSPHSVFFPASAAEAEVDDSPQYDHVVSKPGIPAYMPLTSYPDDPLTMLLDSSSRPNYEPPKKRLRRHCHPEYSETEPPSSVRRDFIHSRTQYSAYNHTASAFLDLVNDPPPQPTFLSKAPDRLRLRIASRKRKCPIDEDGEETEKGLLYPSEQFDHNGTGISASDERFRSRGTYLWPPLDAPDELLALLCPLGQAGKVDAVSDERCLVYSTRPPDHEYIGRPIILISFDPNIRFKTFRRLHGSLRPEGPPTTREDDRQGREFPQISTAMDSFTSARGITDTEEPSQESESSWFSVQRAMHLDIDTAYWLR